MNYLSKDNCAIMISHRLTNIQDANHIYVMDNGCIIEHGSHGELLKQHGLHFVRGGGLLLVLFYQSLKCHSDTPMASPIWLIKIVSSTSFGLNNFNKILYLFNQKLLVIFMTSVYN